MLNKILLAAAFTLCGQAVFAESYTAELTNAHAVAAGWKSQQSGGATAQIDLSPDGTTLSLTLQVTGVALDELAAAGKGGVLGPIHIHNAPQGNPEFFVLQLPGSYVETKDGFDLVLKDWTIEAPKGGAKVDAAFVVEQIRKGNAYIGLHTENGICKDAEGKDIACAAPATALSGQIVAVAE